MSRSGPTKEEYDSLIYKLATLESELGQARKLLEAPAKVSWWRRFWGIGFVVLIAVVFAASFPAYAQTKKDREEYAAITSLRIFFNKGVEVRMLVEGPKGTTLRIEDARLTDSDQIITPKAVAMWKKLGFRQVIITNGDQTWDFDVNKLRTKER